MMFPTTTPPLRCKADKDTPMKKLIPILLSALACTGCPSTNDKSAAASPALTFIVINDASRVDNLPYVRSLRTELEKTDGDVLVLYAGDIVYPSPLSQRYNGSQMIDAMNLLDGDPIVSDPHLFVAFGQHEFDKSRRGDAVLLQSRIDQSQFDWLGSNVVFSSNVSGIKLVSADNLVNTKLITANGIKVGLVGVTSDSKTAKYVEQFLPPVDAVREKTKQLRAQGAQLVVAITHQTLAKDKDLLAALGNDAPDFIAGGHEQERHDEVVNGHHIVKADPDAASAAVVRISLQQPSLSKEPPSSAPQATQSPTAQSQTGQPQTNQLQTAVRYVTFPDHYAQDPAVQLPIAEWQTRFQEETCIDHNAPDDCMQKVAATPTDSTP
jgi:2',3'-cyclic-nucleotide 2'-phosphodiesterase (5'-nucleotidase family)